ncbi:phage terminase large subunit [Fusobacterium polymorphum]|uniref:phage terminase large subunit n=1 Tax=Fusobacterium nucleatum subsp. polymorphum TaxID=76857 RepID=UPI00300BF83E
MTYDKELIKLEAKKELARRDFWYYCKLLGKKDFYNDRKEYLKDLCSQLQSFIDSNKKILVINMPPRFGKSYTATLFVQWLLGRNNKLKIMTGSYNETLSSTFAKQVRDMIATEQTQGVTVYRDIFPDTKIKYGEASMNKWALEGSQVANYLATSPTGTATGFGADLIIIDDLIKNSEEAYNSNVLEKHIDWFTNTMLSRTEKGFKLIIIMTRWASNDLAGFILSNYDDVVHINYKAINDDGTPLDEGTLSLEDFEFKTKNMAKEIVYANYQQEPIDIKGRLYSEFKTYVDLPKEKIVKISAYCDTADTGEDFLCNIIYADCKDSAYILDVIYTKEAMEITEPLVAEAYKKFNVNVADIESNNGGRAFARNIERITRDKGNYKTVVKWFHQSGNKIARILSNSAWVNNNIYMPIDWKNKWSEFAKDIISYQKEGKNKHDDGPDALTGVAEKTINRNEMRTIDRNSLGIR